MPSINVRSSANLIKAQGVSSCYNEQFKLVSEGLATKYKFYVNSMKKSDIVHYHTVNLSYYFERLIQKHKKAGIGYVHFLPDTVDNSLNMPLIFKKVFYKYLLSFYNNMDYLVAVNPCVIEKLRKYGVTKPKIIYIPNYVSEKKFYPLPSEKINAIKSKYDFDKNKFVVLGVGQLQTRKGVADFVQTAKNLPDIQFVWAGGFSFGKISDGYKEIKSLIKNSPSNIKFLGIVDRKDMNEIYNMADILFLPSFDELFPMAILESYCCKTPVLLRDIDIYPRILFDSYMKANSVENFTQIIDELSKNKSLQAKWQDKVWECHEYYSKENILRMWDNLYSEAYDKLKKSTLK